MSHLEELIYQYYDWKGYVVRKNVKVGRLKHGGWAGELDIVAFRHQDSHLVHIEPSIDALSWDKREMKMRKKFEVGQKYIYKEVFPWLHSTVTLEQIAILVSQKKGMEKIAGGKLMSIDEFIKRVKEDVYKTGIMAKSAIPEQYSLLRTIQMTICGYYQPV